MTQRRRRTERWHGATRRQDVTLAVTTFEKIRVIARWEGRSERHITQMLVSLGLDVYDQLLAYMEGREFVPGGLPAIPGRERLIEAIGRGKLAKKAAVRLVERTKELLEREERRESA